ncbi:MAG: helix-hairpin-helix domain-containing protein [Bacteroidetes bacterium]|nr:helix-hairpin-helix domain-containing protein [Bacteroidota bacterium]
MWRWLEKYFTFTQSEKAGIILLVLASLLAFIVPATYLYYKPIEHTDNSLYQKEADAFIKEFNEKKELALLVDSLRRESVLLASRDSTLDSNSSFKKKKERKITYFEFDPNKIGIAEWMKLGFSEKQAESIEKLKAKGYKFRKPEDLKSVFVVGEENYNRLSTYIKIDPNDFPKKEFPKPVYPEKQKEKYVVDINSADSSLFERQRGIGPSLASRIIKYRERLGGFVSTEQIREVWNFPDSTYQSLKDKFVVNEIALKKIKLNTDDFETMRKHPYINYSFAKVFMAYKKEHGNFKTVEDLKKIAAMNDSIFKKMQPYLSVE